MRNLKIIIFLGAGALLSCSHKKSDPPPAPVENENAKPVFANTGNGEDPELEMEILNAQRLQKTVADQDDIPKLYMIQGKLRNTKSTLLLAHKGETFCYTRLRRQGLEDGERIVISKVRVGEQKSGLHYVTLSRYSQNRGMALVCAHLKKAVTLDGAQAAVKDLLLITPTRP